MALIKFNPGISLRDSMIPNNFNKLMDSWMDEAFANSPLANFKPAVDVTEDNDKYYYHVSLPGAKKDDIKVDVHNGVITISGERKIEKSENAKVHRMESYYGSFSRSFSLPEDVNADNIKAEFKDGILNISLPKVEQVKPKSVSID